MTTDAAGFDRRLYTELWEGGDLALADDLIAPDVILDGRPLGRAGYRDWVVAFRRAFPDLTVHIDEQVAAADAVASRFTCRGTHTGPIGPGVLPGWSGEAIAPTGKAVTWTATTLHRLADGRLVAGWVNEDLFGLLRQLGVLPEPAADEVQPS